MFNRINTEYELILNKSGVTPTERLPHERSRRRKPGVARERDGVGDGPTTFEAPDRFDAPRPPVGKGFRVLVGDVYKFKASEGDRRIDAGKIESKVIVAGAEVFSCPSGRHSRAKAIAVFQAVPPSRSVANQAIGFTLTDQILCLSGKSGSTPRRTRPHKATRPERASSGSGGNRSSSVKEYFLSLGTARVAMRLEAVRRIIGGSTLEACESIEPGGVRKAMFDLPPLHKRDRSKETHRVQSDPKD